MFLAIVGVVVAVLLIGATVETLRKKRRSGRDSLGQRINGGNTQGHEYRTPNINQGGSYGG
ncbi:hypothetical protein ASG90_00485 [Nocardioides sp. Soil797]|nr:hypothetical protein ASG90_00485 [Nocardioides sp. Soil797]